MSKLRVTPLNIVAAIAAGLCLYYWFNQQNAHPSMNIKGLYIWVLAWLVVVAFVTDIIFRFTLKSLKKIWLVELLFIVFTVAMMLIFSK